MDYLDRFDQAIAELFHVGRTEFFRRFVRGEYEGDPRLAVLDRIQQGIRFSPRVSASPDARRDRCER